MYPEYCSTVLLVLTNILAYQSQWKLVHTLTQSNLIGRNTIITLLLARTELPINIQGLLSGCLSLCVFEFSKNTTLINYMFYYKCPAKNFRRVAFVLVEGKKTSFSVPNLQSDIANLLATTATTCRLPFTNGLLH